MTRSSAIAVFGSSQTDPNSPEWAAAEEVGRRLATSSFTVMTGGYGGTMEAVSKGASEAGGHVVGVTAPTLFPDRHGANQYVNELIEASGLSDRIGRMLDRAAGTIALPGSIGTAAELVVAWNANNIARRMGGSPIPTTAVGRRWAAVATALSEEINAVPTEIYLAVDIDSGLDWLIGQL